MNARTKLPLDNLRRALLTHQKRRAAGDDLRPLKELAADVGVHRDTFYAFVQGARVSPRSEFAIRRAVGEMLLEDHGKPQTRLGHVRLGADGPRLGFGAAINPILRRR